MKPCTRKLTKRGYNYFVSLPTEWSRKNKIKKGDAVLLTDIGKKELKLQVI